MFAEVAAVVVISNQIGALEKNIFLNKKNIFLNKKNPKTSFFSPFLATNDRGGFGIDRNDTGVNNVDLDDVVTMNERRH